MFSLILFLFITLPIIEIYLLLAVGQKIGVLPTLGLIILTAIIGMIMLRQQSIVTLQRLQNQLQQNEIPAQILIEGLMLLVGGILLLTPGFFTDALGFICLLPWTRQILAGYLSHRMQQAAAQQARSRTASSPPKPPTPHPPSTIEGECKRED